MSPFPRIPKNFTYLRDDPSPPLSNDPHSRLYMPPDTIVPKPWLLDDSVREDFNLDFDGGFDLEYLPTAIAWERVNDVYLLDDGSRYLFWYPIADRLARIVYPTQLHKIMEAFSFDGEMKLEAIEDPSVYLPSYEYGMQLTVIRTT